MGSGQSNSFDVYNSDSTAFWNYYFENESIEQGKVKDFSLVSLFAQHRIQLKGGTNCTSKDIYAQIKKDGLDGIKVNGLHPPTIDDEVSKDILSKLTYLSFYALPWSNADLLLDYVKGASNLKRIELINISLGKLTKEFWGVLLERSLDYLSISASNMGNMTDTQLIQICNKVKKYRFSDDGIKRVLNIPELAKVYAEKGSLIGADLHWIDRAAQIPDLLLLIKPDSALKLDSPDQELVSALFDQLNQSEIKLDYLGIPNSQIYPLKVEFTDKIHFWNSAAIPAVLEIIKRSPQITKITSGFSALTRAEKANLEEEIQKLGRQVDLKVDVSDEPEPEPTRVNLVWGDPDREAALINKLIVGYQRELDNYSSCEAFRTLARSYLDQAKYLAELFNPFDTTHLEKVKKLNLRYDKLTKGRHMKGVCSDLIGGSISIETQTWGSIELLIEDKPRMEVETFKKTLESLYGSAEEKLVVERNAEYGVWTITEKNTVFLVRSPKNPKVYGVLTEKGVIKKLTVGLKKLAGELNLDVE